MQFIKGTIPFYEYELSDQVANNIRSWLDYSLIQMGAFTNFQFSNSSTSGYTTLQQTSPTVFESLAPSWVWENDIQTIDSSPNPIIASGIHINSTFYPPTTSGQYSYNMNFRKGEVVFNSPQSGILVQCEHAGKDVDVYLSDSPQWKRLITNYLDQYNNLGTSAPSGLAAILKENRVWLPSVVIETSDNNNTGLQLGGGDYANIKVLYHVFSDRPFSNKRLCDLINNQREVSLNFYDANKAPFPYTSYGTIASGAMTYSQLAVQGGQYYWTNAYIKESQGGPRDDLFDVYRAEIRQTLQIQRYPSTY